MCITELVGRFGPEALAGRDIVSRLEFLLLPLVFGVGAAMTSIVGVNIGAGQWQRAERVSWIGASIAGFVARSSGCSSRSSGYYGLVCLLTMPWCSLRAKAIGKSLARFMCFRALACLCISPLRV
jgi:hypothetical protein